jgi:putative transcriptional regulator
MSKTTISNKLLRPMTPAGIEAAARSDPDAQPLTPDDLKRMKRTPRAKMIRRARAASTQNSFPEIHTRSC